MPAFLVAAAFLVVVAACEREASAPPEAPAPAAQTAYLQALDLFEAGDLDAAETLFRQALEEADSASERAMIHNDLGNLARRRGRYSDALAALRAGLALAPHPTLLHPLHRPAMPLASRDHAASDPDGVRRHLPRAREAFEKSLAIARQADPGALAGWAPAKTHALLGQVLYSLNEKDLARRHLHASLELEPTGAVAAATRKYLEFIGEP